MRFGWIQIPAGLVLVAVACSGCGRARGAPPLAPVYAAESEAGFGVGNTGGEVPDFLDEVPPPPLRCP